VASPQLENGFTRIANELLLALATADLTKREHAILYFVFRWTYGFRRKSAQVTTAELAKATHFGQPHCTNALASLARKGLVTLVRRGRFVTVTVQKDWERWRRRGTVYNSPARAAALAAIGKKPCRQGNDLMPLPARSKATDGLQQPSGSHLNIGKERERAVLRTPRSEVALTRDPLYRSLSADKTWGEPVLRTVMARIARTSGLTIDSETATIAEFVRAFRAHRRR